VGSAASDLRRGRHVQAAIRARTIVVWLAEGRRRHPDGVTDEHDPDGYREALRQGHVAILRGRPRVAIGHYQEAGRLAGGRPLPYTAMGSVYLQMRQSREALEAFDEALRRAPNDIGALRGKASALEADGRTAEAVALAKRADEVEAMERAGRGGAVSDDALRQLETGIAEGERARSAGDLDRATAAYHAAAIGYARTDHVMTALDACLRALEANPGAIDVHFTMAQLYFRAGWTDLAVQRVLLLDHRLDVDADPRRRAAVRALARDHRAQSPELERLAAAAA
jgi:tetratricopeptide (TPR) repeat protein